jgi:hypothetical protein
MTRAGAASLVVAGLAAGLAVGAEPARSSDRAPNGLEHWARIHEVLSHPRCANCHVGSDHVPMWSGPGYGPRPRPHGMNVSGGESRVGAESGLVCSTCHARRNATLPHAPPGAPVWALAPLRMQWFGKTSAEICAQLKDPKRNGGRTLLQVAHHVEHDALVQWGWDPGPGREPPPYSSAELAGFIRAWARQGAPCPP